MLIRSLTAADWPAVAAVYGEGIAGGNATFETDVPSWEAWDRARLSAPRLVAQLEEDVVGFAALTPVSPRAVYRGVCDVRVYVASRAQGRGVGRTLLKALIGASEEVGVWTLQAGVFPENEASLHLHEACGFRRVGVRERIGRQGSVWRDVVLLERRSPSVP